ncbi:hypothetical protein MSIM_47380 [Mycobacterium simiae]|nr:hypothetical protein MSIM_47380 [Mycobacterium simiae]
MLRNARSGPLAEQQGFTVDDLRNAYGRGEEQARQVAEKNGVKANAYGIAYDSTLSLQHGLTALANEGNQRIREVQDSSQPAAGKVTQIVTVVNQYQALSNIAAAKYSGNVLDAMQTILDCDGTGLSARQDAQSNGLNVGEMFRGRPQSRDLEQQVGGMLEKGGTTPGPGSVYRNPQAPSGREEPNTPNPLATSARRGLSDRHRHKWDLLHVPSRHRLNPRVRSLTLA